MMKNWQVTVFVWTKFCVRRGVWYCNIMHVCVLDAHKLKLNIIPFFVCVDGNDNNACLCSLFSTARSLATDVFKCLNHFWWIISCKLLSLIRSYYSFNQLLFTTRLDFNPRFHAHQKRALNKLWQFHADFVKQKANRVKMNKDLEYLIPAKYLIISIF